MSIPPSLFDKRVVRRSIKKGLVDPEQYKSMLDQLPDRSDNVAEPEPFSEPSRPESVETRGERLPRKASPLPEASPVSAPEEGQENRDLASQVREPEAFDGQEEARQLPAPEPVGIPQGEKLEAGASGEDEEMSLDGEPRSQPVLEPGLLTEALSEPFASEQTSSGVKLSASAYDETPEIEEGPVRGDSFDRS